ncbi:MAG TPA: hypothetical protein DEP48_01625 [Persephonella sp.]|uniref:Uncharacterized protein n=1 Tax=Persephonella marina (strain DSM 14350 / EX-H1) TaxID=123214 RepID=C0QRJ5_PERMH|nr:MULTISPECIES: hypothetical protein [Persephonella]ACO04116.1 hypothetical protein PERMA_1524 [Persephonella marina EX-H1]HCB69036.1 hypothetical protein [Persephonella sp.]
MLAQNIIKYWKFLLAIGIILAVGGLFIPNQILGKIVEFTGFAILAVTAYVLGYKMATDEAEKYIRSEMEKLAKRDIRYKLASEKMIKHLKGKI